MQALKSILLLKSLADYATVVSGTSVSRGISFFTSILVARWFGAEAFGEYSIFFITSTLTWQVANAFDITFIRNAKRLNDKNEILSFLAASLTLKAVYTLVMLIGGICLSNKIAADFFLKPNLQNSILYGIISGVFISFLRTKGALYQLDERYHLYSLIYLIYTGSIFLGLCASWFFSPDMNVQNLVFLFSIISVVIGFGSIISLLINGIKFKSYNLKIVIDSLSFGKWVFGVTLLYSLFVRLDVLLISRFVGYRELGIYSVAAQIIMIISLFTGAMSGIFLPKSMAAVTSKEKIKIYFQEVIMPVGLVLLLILGILIFAPLIINTCFGKEYSEAIPLLRILLIGWVFQVLFMPLQYIFYGINKTQFRFFLELFKVVFLSILLFVLVPKFSVTGGAWSISFVYALNMIVASYTLFKTYSKMSIAKEIF